LGAPERTDPLAKLRFVPLRDGCRESDEIASLRVQPILFRHPHYLGTSGALRRKIADGHNIAGVGLPFAPMFLIGRGLFAGTLLLIGRTLPAWGQASLYIPLDDSRLPLLEHLIVRGDIEDPSPFIRPFRLRDAVRVLSAADTTSEPTRSLVRRLRLEFTEDTASARWSVDVRAGGQAYTQKRRDPLHVGGPGTANWYADIGLKGVLGPFALASRPAAEPSLIGDPDWPNETQEHVTGRLIEGYISGQVRFGSLTYGQLQRNWGPVGLPGIALSDYGYQRQGLALELGTGAVRLQAIASDLRSELAPDGDRINRYLFAHRLEARLARRLRIALWESSILQGEGRVLETPFANPVSLSFFTNTFGINEEGNNVMIGADIHWQPHRVLTLQTQLAIDDFLFNKRYEAPDRYALTLAAFGPVGRRLAWRAMYTQVSSLALRTFNPLENFVDAGVGTGRQFTDMDLLLLRVSLPAARTFLLSPEVVFQRQGEGSLDDPFPPRTPDPRTPDGIIDVPRLFIGTVEKTYRIGVGVSGRRGPLEVLGNIGYHHVTNSLNQPGATADRIVARVQATLAWRRSGSLRD
jgi:hypothetical protein